MMKIMRSIFRVLMLALLCAPAWAQPTLLSSTPLTLEDGCQTTCTLGDIALSADADTVCVGFFFRYGSTGVSTPPTSVTLEGEAMTEVFTEHGSGQVGQAAWYCSLAADLPAAGASKTLVVSGTAEAVTRVGACVMQFDGAKQQGFTAAATPVGAASTSTTTLATNITTLVDNAIILKVAGTTANRTSSIDDADPLIDACETTIVSTSTLYATHADKATAGLQETSTTWSSATQGAAAAMALEQAAAVSTPSSFSAVISGDPGWPGPYEIQSVPLPSGNEEQGGDGDSHAK